MSKDHQNATVPRGGDVQPAWLDIVRKKVGSLRFGVVQIVVHDAEVVQIEQTERIRFGGVRSGKTGKFDPVEDEP